jgi:RNA polymerase primary sigma factor
MPGSTLRPDTERRPSPESRVDPLDFYLEEVERGRHGDAHVREGLRYVIAVANSYRSHGLPLEDLIQEGNIGLLVAVRKFDPARGVKFTTYAHSWIRKAIQRAIDNGVSNVRIPASKRAAARRIRKLRREAERSGAAHVCPRKLAEAAGLKIDDLNGLDAIESMEFSIDEVAPGAGRPMHDMLVSEEPEGSQVDAVIRAEVMKAVSKLGGRQAKVLKLSFGMADGREYSNTEIAALIGLTAERVRQIRQTAIERIRSHLEKVAA